jgi:hypothetical protein
MPHCDHQDDEAVVLDGGDDAVIADAVAPQPLAVAGDRMTQAARVFAAGDTRK